MMTCEDFAERVTAYLDGRVPYGERLGMWVHSMICGHCRTYLRQMSEVVDLMSDVDADADDGVEPGQREQLMEAFRASKRSEDA